VLRRANENVLLLANRKLDDAIAGDLGGTDHLAIVGYALVVDLYRAALNVTAGFAIRAGKASAEEIHRVFSTVFHSGFAAVTSTEEWIAAAREGKALERDNVYLSVQRTLKA